MFSMPAMPAMGMAANFAAAVTLSAKGQGVYEGSLELDSGGTWHVAVAVQRAGTTIATKMLNCRRNGRDVMISRIIAWCASNPFLVFTAAILLTVAGVWSLQKGATRRPARY